MAKRSIGKRKVEEKTMVVCPICGGTEFSMNFDGELIVSNIHRAGTKGENTLYDYEVVGIENVVNEPNRRIFTCVDCETEIFLLACFLAGIIPSKTER